MSTSGTIWIVESGNRMDPCTWAALADQRHHLRPFPDLTSFLAGYAPQPPECLLARLEAPNGPALRQLLLEVDHRMPVLFISAHPSADLAVDAMRSGASDYLVEPVDADRLSRSLADALAWSALYQGELERARKARFLLSRLTRREQDVLQLVLEGLSTKRIASLLGISPKTIDVHRSHISQKLGAESLVDLIRLGLAAQQLEMLEGRLGSTAATRSLLARRIPG